jgi:Flp pilus assembly protein TadG
MIAFANVRRSCNAAICFLRSLGADDRGNTSIMVAAALLPILGMIGAGLDLSRAYLARAKMQSACDSAALGARRAMASSTLDQASIDEGKKFFNFNFPAGTMEAAPVDLDIHASPTDESTVIVVASTTIPTSIMKIFGFRTLPASITCSADQDYVNNDIMLVLDVTGSMNCKAGTGTSCAYQATEQTGSRISKLRSAAVSLYKALEGATGVRTRYGFMPYSMTVNVGKDLNGTWIANPANYWKQVSVQVCVKKDKKGNCTQYQTQTQWQLTPVTHTSSWLSSTWGGCVEERSTESQTGSTIKISSDVAQGDIDDTGNTPALQWQPYDESIDQGQSDPIATNLKQFCPAKAKRLAEYGDDTAFSTALNASVAKVGGYTNHDLGMTWGMRYLSSTGMFSSDNPTIYNEIPVDKHIVFLTDGTMTASTANYSSFGVPAKEDRMVKGDSDLVQRHIDRFLNACDQAREMGATIWVIALDVPDAGSLDAIKQCASGDDHFFTSNGSDLDLVFTRIGRGIGRLRMTQ